MISLAIILSLSLAQAQAPSEDPNLGKTVERSVKEPAKKSATEILKERAKQLKSEVEGAFKSDSQGNSNLATPGTTEESSQGLSIKGVEVLKTPKETPTKNQESDGSKDGISKEENIPVEPLEEPKMDPLSEKFLNAKEKESEKGKAEEKIEDDKIPEWNCRVDSTPAEAGGFTVGERFSLLCEGERVSFGKGDMYFQLPEQLLYALRILNIEELTSNKVVLSVTTYLAGKMNLQEVYFAEDGVEKFKVKPFLLSTASVLPPQNPGEKGPEPFPPRTGFRLGYSVWVKIALGAFVFLIFLYFFFRWYRREQKQRVLYELKKHSSALGAYNQFNKDLRSIGRAYVFSKHKPWDPSKIQTYLEKLDSLFRMFLLREFLVPANDWKSGAVLKEIRKHDKMRFQNYGNTLEKYLKELDRARKVQDQISMDDCKQLTVLARKVSQKVWQERKGRRLK